MQNFKTGFIGLPNSAQQDQRVLDATKLQLLWRIFLRKNSSLKASSQKTSVGLSAGFTLIELLIITSVTIILSTYLFNAFGSQARREQAIRRSAAVFQADLRRSQSLSISARDFVSEQICGYGIRYLDGTHYQIYKGSNEGGLCANSNHNYQAGIDSIFQTFNLPDLNIRFPNAFSDIFFEPPDPKTYLNNNANLNAPPVNITMCYGVTNICKNISIYTSGRVEVQ